MVNVKTGSEDEVLETLKALPGVTEAHKVYGVYDTIVRIEAKTMQELKDIIYEKVRRADMVTSIITMIVI